MAQINYKDLGLKKEKEKTLYQWDSKYIEVNKYLPIEDKYDIVMITLQKSFEDGIYNSIKLDMYFHLNLIYMYTNLIFTDEERQDEFKLYDEMKSSGFIDEFLKHIDPDEYKEMQEEIEEIGALKMKYNLSAANIFKSFINDLPANAEAAQSIVNNFDKEKFQNVIDFALAANGKRPLD